VIESCEPTLEAVSLALHLKRGEFDPTLPAMTKLIAKLSKQGDWMKALFVYQCLPQLGLCADTTVTNAALTACGRGSDAARAREVFFGMREYGLVRDAITYRAAISALCKGDDWEGAALVRGRPHGPCTQHGQLQMPAPSGRCRPCNSYLGSPCTVGRPCR
jgi:pentatricopeptide repeat protein